MVLSKTFDFMKIVLQFSYVVTMIERVVKDLKSFLFFYTILIFQLSMILDVILMSNPDPNYESVGPFIGNVLATMRISLGDFDFTELKGDHLTKHEHWLFWVMWILMVQFSLLIFLNFIIAEVSNSYAIVSENIDEIIQKERARLILEAEDVLTDYTKLNNKEKFPKYIIVREKEKTDEDVPEEEEAEEEE